MPPFRISVTNENFQTTNDHDFASLAAAIDHAIRGALNIGTDEIVGGKSYFGAEVTVKQDGAEGARFVVSAGVSALR